MKLTQRAIGAFGALFCLGVLQIAQANPPDHAPAHGYRNNTGNYVGYTGHPWARDFGVLQGNCDARGLAATIGTGGTTDQAAAILIEAIFRQTFPDAANAVDLALDSYCFGHTLELVPTGQSVYWKNPNTGTDIYLTPGKKSNNCRTYNGMKVSDGKKSRFSGIACSTVQGQWKIVK